MLSRRVSSIDGDWKTRLQPRTRNLRSRLGIATRPALRSRSLDRRTPLRLENHQVARLGSGVGLRCRVLGRAATASLLEKFEGAHRATGPSKMDLSPPFRRIRV